MNQPEIPTKPASALSKALPGDQHRQAVRDTAVGTLQDLLASALSLPLGLVAAALLSRTLGPEGYGVFSVAISIVLWLEISLIFGFSRTAVTFIARARDWHPVAAALINAQFFASVLVAGLLAIFAPGISTLLNSPELAPHLRLLALDIPIATVAAMHSSVLVGLGQYARRALLTALYSAGRLLLLVLFISLGFSIQGAVFAYIGASILMLGLGRFFVHPPLSASTGFSLAGLWQYTLPLLVFTVVMNLFQSLDLLLVKALVPADQAAGHYSAAQNLAGVLGLLAAAFSPLLLATLSRVAGQNGPAFAKKICRQSLRLIFCLLPLIAVAAGTANEIIHFVYGAAFAPGTPVLMVLLFSGLGRLVIAATSSTLTAAGRPDLVAKLILPTVPLALLFDWLLVPRFGLVAAASVTITLTWSAAIFSLAAVRRVWQVPVPVASFFRSLGVAAIVFLLLIRIPVGGWWLFPKLASGVLLGLVGLALVRELRYAEIRQWAGLIRRPVTAKPEGAITTT